MIIVSSHQFIQKALKMLQIIFVGISMFSCVGTIQDKNPKVTKGATADTSPIKFDGIFEAKAIADSKIDVFFFPSSMEPKEVTYLISYDGISNPISVPGTTLTTNYRGLLKYTVTGLNINTTYSFSVQAKNVKGEVSTSSAIYSEKTFSNITADFAGIGNVRNLAGEDGRTALRIEWPAARSEGGTFTPAELDPKDYEIVLLNADHLTPSSFDDDFFGEPYRKVSTVDGKKISHQVNGLTAGTKYFIRVRAIHYGPGGDDSIEDRKEENSNYVLAQTLSDDSSDVDVNLSRFEVDILSLNSVGLEWEAASGPLVEYRVYYRNVDTAGLAWSSYRTSRSDSCDGEDPVYPEWGCKKLNFDETSTKLADLEPLANYEIIPVICMTSVCSYPDSIEYEHNSPYTIFPGIAEFAGINEIEHAKYYWATDEVYIKLNSIDNSSGAIDGLLVEAKARSSDEGPSFNTILNHPSVANNSNLSIDSFDFESDDTIVVSGLSLTSAEQYCFSVLPFIYNKDVVQISREGEVVKCIALSVTLPDTEEFSGLNLSITSPGNTENSVSLFWEEPSAGVYDRFRIFIKNTESEDFSFAEAMNYESNDYTMIEVPYGTTRYTFSSLPDGEYGIGILPYYSNNDEYSPFNLNIYTFDTDD